MSNKTQIDLLANYIMAEIPGEPSRSEGAGDTAIRLLTQLQEQNIALQKHNTKLEQDGKRLDWWEKCGEALSVSWVKGNPQITLSWIELDGGIMCESYAGGTLRRAIDKAMAKGE